MVCNKNLTGLQESTENSWFVSLPCRPPPSSEAKRTLSRHFPDPQTPERSHKGISPVLQDSTTPVLELVLFPGQELVRVLGVDLVVGVAVADACVDLIQRFPAQLGERDAARRLDGAFQGGRPHTDRHILLWRKAYDT